MAAAAGIPPSSAVKPVARPAAKSAPQRALEKLGLVGDVELALHLPLRYEDETRLARIADLREGDTAQVEGVVRDARVETRARRQLVVRLDDGSGELVLRFLHFYPSHRKLLAPGARVRAMGEVRGGFLGREMVHPACRAVEPGTPLPATLTPVYPTTAGLPQAYLRKAVASALARAPLDDPWPREARERWWPPGLPSLREALEFLHHPPPRTPLATLDDRSHPAWQRLKFDELLAQQLSQRLAQRERAALAAPALRAAPGGLPERLLAALPFTLTAAQRRVAGEIAADLARAQPMHRLLQGDVGSGKTVVAALAAAVAIDAGWQCALMAPTEILAEQHFAKLVQWLEPLGVSVAWLAGSRRGKVRAQQLERIAGGAAQLVVGTHAVIQHDVAFARLGLAIVDEQHRFGVAQRLALRRKLDAAALEPHLLMMSATPIPRTLAMTYYADLAVSTIDELPPGRTPIVTKVFADTRRDDVIARIRDEVAHGRQVYWVCPLVDESEHVDLRHATETHAQLSAAMPGVGVGLLHGRMAPADKAAVMSQFASGQMPVLVATTVIEVGVDVPNASLMVVEHAERFGLAQLHQLRGRVGRGAAASVCVLLYTPPLSETGKQRLRAMAETTDGFEIARRDLEIRGPGEFMGARQSGDALLRFADLASDEPLVQRARAAADALLDAHPQAARAHVRRWLGQRTELLKA
ncbi:ATP-dependent DNA helicase RecG [Calidifontimicrobium sp. SYSU G02091]|uniref:ATP-dependent DNA helicase RecG n=1 Tax=Calidifontimicrobium sp. SYSU G02091 TaxID=2926421 RepID=UPI001F5301A2|nr:ATP-dependent DNA helicase RecG [Calidifontimicrobium sp. SYSU G02091]MCI1191669.1 ATP-dependent DNA helicase RecG [Calidifontimicrobium sp. SYSU G02091]